MNGPERAEASARQSTDRSPPVSVPSLLRRLRNWAASQHPVDLGSRIADTILISGVGRSGTTWLSDFLNFDGRYRDLFEPFHAWKVADAEVLKGHWYQDGAVDPPEPCARFVERVLRGRIRDPWVDRFNRRVVSRRRLVKAIRADLFLGWVARRFPELRIVHLIRHPAAVAQSRASLPLGWKWQPTLDELLTEERLRASLTQPRASLCETARSPFEQHIASWCLSTRAVEDNVAADRRITVFYEDLVLNPEVALRGIFASIGRTWDPRCLGVHGLDSATARRRTTPSGSPPDPALATWVDRMSEEERRWLDRALDTFDLGGLYSPTGHPRAPSGGAGGNPPSPSTHA